MMPKTIVVHGLEVVDAGVVVEAPPGHIIVVETAAFLAIKASFLGIWT